MSMEYSKLRGRIVEKYGTMTAFAEKLNIKVQTVSRKLNSDIGFTKDDILVWSDLLDIPKEEIGIYFFS